MEKKSLLSNFLVTKVIHAHFRYFEKYQVKRRIQRMYNSALDIPRTENFIYLLIVSSPEITLFFHVVKTTGHLVMSPQFE